MLLIILVIFSTTTPQGITGELQLCSEREMFGGFKAVMIGRSPSCDNGRWGFVDATGKTVIPPNYTDVGHFSEGLAAVQVGSSWGFIDTSGEMVIKPRFSAVACFVNGLASVRFGSKLYGFIDHSGEVVVPAQFEIAGSFSEGVAAVFVEKGWFFIDRNATVVFEVPGAPVDVAGFDSGLAKVYTMDGEYCLTRNWHTVECRGFSPSPVHQPDRYRLKTEPLPNLQCWF